MLQQNDYFWFKILLLLCVIDVLKKHACVIPLKGKNGETIVKAFHAWNRKRKNIWFEKVKEFYSRQKNIMVKSIQDRTFCGCSQKDLRA